MNLIIILGDLCSMSFDEDELQSSLPLEAGQSTKLLVKVNGSMPAKYKIVLEDRRFDSPDGGSYFPRFIQPIADSPDLGDPTKSSASSKCNDKSKSLPGAPKKGPKSSRFSIYRGKESSDGQIKVKNDYLKVRINKRPNTTDDVDVRRKSTHYSSPQLENRLSMISNSSSFDSLALEAESQPQPLPVYKLASAEFELEYTGGPAADEGYYRKTKLCITTRVLPVFHFSQFDVMPCAE